MSNKYKNMKSINITLWLNCNLKCPYCFANPIAPPKKWGKEIEKQLNFLSEFLNQTGPWDITFTGGEPTIYPGFSFLCSKLVKQGHQVSFISNGIEPLHEQFIDNIFSSIKEVSLSYHLVHEKSSKYAKNFKQNIKFLVNKGIKTTVNYVLYPERNRQPHEVKKEFETLGADFKFLAFQGESKGIQYPKGYTETDKTTVKTIGDIRSRFVVEHGEYCPTFKKCRAGFEFFSLSLHTGSIYVCEQLQHIELANIYSEKCVQDFNQARYTRAMPCPAKKCFCRFTVEQEEFLTKHDVWDMSNYPEWEKISLPTVAAQRHWSKQEQQFVRELSSRISGEKILIWGGGMHTQSLLELLNNFGFPMNHFIGIIDSNTLKQGGEIKGIKIRSLNASINNLLDCSDVIISSRAFENEISKEVSKYVATSTNVIKLYNGSMSLTMESFN